MRFARFLSEVSTPDFDVSVDFGEGKFTPAGSFHSESAAKREGAALCKKDGSGKRYKVTNNVTGKSKVFSPDTVTEGESNYVAMSAYKANTAKVQQQMDMLALNIQKHRERYMATDRQDWGYAGDLEKLNQQLTEINDWLRK